MVDRPGWTAKAEERWICLGGVNRAICWIKYGTYLLSNEVIEKSS